jgi:hypothetical protein
MSLYYVLTDRSTMQLRQGDLCVMGEVTKARKARSSDPEGVRFIFTLKRGGNVRKLSERDFGSETLTIWRPRPGTQITSLPA